MRFHGTLAFVAATVAAAPAAAEDALRRQLLPLATALLKVSEGQPLAVGNFSLRAEAERIGIPTVNSGLGLEAALTAALDAAAAAAKLPHKGVNEHAALQVNGTYELAASGKANRPGKVVRLSSKVVRADNLEVILQNSALNVELDGNTEVALAGQVTALVADMRPDSEGVEQRVPKEERAQAIADAYDRPQVVVAGTEIRSRPESKLVVEILAKPRTAAGPLRARAAKDENGSAYVELAKDDVYQVRIHNRDSRRIAVALRIDGLDMYHFSRDRLPDGIPKYSHTVVEPGRSVAIPGWHDSVADKRYLQFLVAELGAGAASKAKAARGEVGVVHLAAAYCSDKQTRGKMETALGPPVEVAQKPIVQYIGKPHDFLAIRYSR